MVVAPLLRALVFAALATLPVARAQRAPLVPPPGNDATLLIETLSAPAFERWGATRFELRTVSLPPRPAHGLATPERLELRVPAPDGEVTLRLLRHDLRSAGARVQVVEEGGVRRHVALPAASTYRGTVVERPGATAVAAWLPGGLRVRVLDGEEGFQVHPSTELDSALPGWHLVFRDRDVVSPPLSCGSDSAAFAGDVSPAAPGEEAAGEDTPPPPQAPSAGPGLTGAGGVGLGRGAAAGRDLTPGQRCVSLCEIAFDADFEYYQLKNSSVDDVIAAIDAYMNEVDLFYHRDARIAYAITGYVVRTAPFYTPVSGGNLLDQFRAEWNANQGAIDRDIAHLMTAKPGNIIEFGGLAWVGAVCTDIGYGWSLDSAGIIGHEVGHNWGSNHCHDLTPCNNMCGACLYIAPNTLDIITAFAATRTCIDPIATPATAVPPYARHDAGLLRKDAFSTGETLVLDVLANDHDGNCQAVQLGGVDALSERGASLVIDPDGGPTGRPRLVYSLPEIPFLGEDAFQYVAVDEDGNAAVGEVRVDVRPLLLAGAWPLDEGSGAVAGDVSHPPADGQITGGPAWTTGPWSGALDFDGLDDQSSAPDLDLGTTDELTITAWVRRDGNQFPLAGLVTAPPGGLIVGIFNELRYAWKGDFAAFGWNSGLALPDDQWVFTALVVEPHQATLYLDDGGGLQSAVNAVSHAPAAFGGPFVLGRDAQVPSRAFRGGLDEVQVYDHALDAAAITAIAAGGGPAQAPRPTDGGRYVPLLDRLDFTLSPTATAADLYLGTDYAQVAGAGTGSPEFQGTFPDTASLPVPALAVGTRYYWRADLRSGPAVNPGDVWQFDPARLSQWPLDETSGVVTLEGSGSGVGTFSGGPLLGQPGATPFTGTSIFLDGANDRVQLPVLDLDSDTVTIAAWVKRDGSQSPWDGLVFCRAGSSVAGLNLGEANELRYHWNGGKWPWNSGLVVPDDTWTFCALVVEPTRATIWMGDGGPLVSAVNAEAHAPEEFDAPTDIGRDPAGGRWFRGGIDAVHIWDAALTAEQIEAFYQLTLTGS